MIVIKRKQKLAAYLRKLGYDAHVRKDYVKVNGEVNPEDLRDVDIPESQLAVIRKATETKIIPREVQAFA